MSGIVVRGDDEFWDIPLVNPQNSNPINLSGHAVWVTVKESPSDADDQAVYQHYIEVDLEGNIVTAQGMSIKDEDPSLGIVVQHLTAAESALLATESYTYDVQVMLPDGTIKSPILGDPETVVPDWTRSVVAPSTEE